MNEVNNSKENHGHGFNAWVKKPKKSILIFGSVLVTIGTGYTVYKNWDSITAIFKIIKPEPIVIKNPPASIKAAIPVVEAIPEIPTETVKIIIKDGEAFGVGEHIRNLPMGRNASMEKIAMATEHGFTLDEHQTWVKNYSKNSA